jgi:hypothetical protein
MIFPPPPANLADPLASRYLSNLVRAITQADRSYVRREVAEGQVLLASPNGSVYTVQVDDAGVISTTLVRNG